jgi:hypothetical protein
MLGRERSVFLLAHGLHTLCMLIVLGVLARRPLERRFLPRGRLRPRGR